MIKSAIASIWPGRIFVESKTGRRITVAKLIYPGNNQGPDRVEYISHRSGRLCGMLLRNFKRQFKFLQGQGSSVRKSLGLP